MAGHPPTLTRCQHGTRPATLHVPLPGRLVARNEVQRLAVVASPGWVAHATTTGAQAVEGARLFVRTRGLGAYCGQQQQRQQRQER